ncbi:MBL fold metallo-hydrolase [Clostridium sp. ZBS15]|uniref:MBL fold metallo-hydrolase n=1 Tax=Clostridium sp. ZBS15 TaxID=2949969 RepID=UPI002079ACB9|nr:MBL fold metallo-hydrolase [Clostridium sp. ZBS15]
MFNKLTDRVYYMDFEQEGDRPVLGLVVGDSYSLVIDGGNSKDHAEKFLNYVQELDIPKIKYLVLTHWHWDHVLGMKTMNLINIVHKKSNEKLEWMKGLEWTDKAIRERVENGQEIEFCEQHIKIEHPNNDRNIEVANADIIFDGSIGIDLGGVTVMVEYINADHSKDCCLVNVVEEKVTFMGDAMYLDMYNGPWSYSREKLYPLLDKLISYGSEYYIPSHHSKYTNEEFKVFIRYIKEIGDLVGESTDLEKTISKINKVRDEELSEWNMEDINVFIEGNKKNRCIGFSVIEKPGEVKEKPTGDLY